MATDIDEVLKFPRQKRWRVRNGDKRRAHMLLQAAVRAGKIKRGCCEVCGSLRVDGHHDDHAKPLEVRWLCRRHHKALEAKLRRTAA